MSPFQRGEDRPQGSTTLSEPEGLRLKVRYVGERRGPNSECGCSNKPGIWAFRFGRRTTERRKTALPVQPSPATRRTVSLERSEDPDAAGPQPPSRSHQLGEPPGRAPGGRTRGAEIGRFAAKQHPRAFAARISWYLQGVKRKIALVPFDEKAIKRYSRIDGFAQLAQSRLYDHAGV